MHSKINMKLYKLILFYEKLDLSTSHYLLLYILLYIDVECITYINPYTSLLITTKNELNDNYYSDDGIFLNNCIYCLLHIVV